MRFFITLIGLVANLYSAPETILIQDLQVKTLKGITNGSTYCSITNTANDNVCLYKVTIKEDVVDHVEIHDHMKQTNAEGQNYMKMVEIPELDIPANRTITLMPGHKHLMLMKIKQTICAFKKLTFEFHFRNANGNTFMIEKSVNMNSSKRCE